MNTFAGAVAASIVAAVAVSEFRAWSPWLVERFLRISIRLLPEGLRDRLNEEWRGHLEEVPGDIGKLLASVGFSLAAYSLRIDEFMEGVVRASRLLQEIFLEAKKLSRSSTEYVKIANSLRSRGIEIPRVMLEDGIVRTFINLAINPKKVQDEFVLQVSSIYQWRDDLLSDISDGRIDVDAAVEMANLINDALDEARKGLR